MITNRVSHRKKNVPAKRTFTLNVLNEDGSLTVEHYDEKQALRSALQHAQAQGVVAATTDIGDEPKALSDARELKIAKNATGNLFDQQ